MWDVVDKLGPWPILQIGAITLVITITVMTYMRVMANKISPTPSSSSTTIQGGSSEVSFLYFQGWFKSVLDELSFLKTNQEMNKLQIKELVSEEIRKSRDDIISRIDDLERDAAKVNSKQRHR